MSILLEFTNHLLAFDFGWIVGFILMNLHWIFAFMAIAYFFTGGKKFVSYFVILVALMWVVLDFNLVAGLVFLTATFFGLHYISRVGVMIFAQDVPYLKAKLALVLTVQVWVVLIVYNLFFV